MASAPAALCGVVFSHDVSPLKFLISFICIQNDLKIFYQAYFQWFLWESLFCHIARGSCCPTQIRVSSSVLPELFLSAPHCFLWLSPKASSWSSPVQALSSVIMVDLTLPDTASQLSAPWAPYFPPPPLTLLSLLRCCLSACPPNVASSGMCTWVPSSLCSHALDDCVFQA